MRFTSERKFFVKIVVAAIIGFVLLLLVWVWAFDKDRERLSAAYPAFVIAVADTLALSTEPDFACAVSFNTLTSSRSSAVQRHEGKPYLTRREL